MSAALSRPSAVLFDWDNTLVDSWAVIHAALNETFTAMDHPNWTRAETEARVRGSLRDTFPGMFGARWQDAEKTFYDAFGRLHLENLTPLPGAAELLRQLAEAGAYLGVVSNKRGHFLRLEAEHLGWDRYFNQLAGAGDAARDKPCREHVDLALGLGSGKAGPAAGPDVWFVGDADIDIVCARNAGCRAILVRAQPPTEEEMAVAAPDLHFPDLSALAEHLRRL
ncbi:HAD family hydrolase [Dongia sedimenti]|uniref:phosphoglycolate phosphatase n=1 Tax=Dongia sedimenti TaxID=3064282 RepID=A0ABU0YJW8_9PROT|nr:HAD family hydrolase [Rhodospirillaceae bacterium R-7]